MKLGRASVSLGAALLALLSGLSTLTFATPASAATPPWEPDPGSVGGLTFFNAAGQQITGGNLTDSPLAAYVEGTAPVRSGDSVATLYGYLPVNGEQPSQWSGEQLSGSSDYPNASAPAPLSSATLPVETGAAGDESVATLEADYPNTDTSNDGYAGAYQLRLRTDHPRGVETAQYDSADILVTGSTWSVVYPVPTPISTTTTVTTSPSSPQVAGTAVTITAAVSPAAPGTVQFEDNGVDVGAPQPLTNGSASITTSALPAGANSLAAAYTPATFANYAGSSGTTSFTVEQAPSITSASSCTFVKGLAGSFTVTASGFPAPTYSESGTLPAGVTFSSAGAFSGTPTAFGTFPVTITASNGVAPNATQDFTLTVAPMGVATSSLPNDPVEKAYSAKLTTTGGKSPFKWALTQGTLPAGFKLASTGTISGTPTTVGTSTFTVKVTDTSKPVNTATATLSITITPLTVKTASLPNGIVKKSYSQKLAATGGKAPLTWTLAAGTLPSGLKLSSTGTVSGTPKAAGTFDFTVGVHDAAKPAHTASAALSITVT